MSRRCGRAATTCRRMAFEAEVDRLFNQMKPLYEQLHCYTRRKLNLMYGDKVAPKAGPIPAHLTGNMWAQSWVISIPRSSRSRARLRSMSRRRSRRSSPTSRWSSSARRSTRRWACPRSRDVLGALDVPEAPGKEAVCHASAWDVQFNNDLRIKMCINKNQEDLDTIHHELGHNYYQSAITRNRSCSRTPRTTAFTRRSATRSCCR